MTFLADELTECRIFQISSDSSEHVEGKKKKKKKSTVEKAFKLVAMTTVRGTVS